MTKVGCVYENEMKRIMVKFKVLILKPEVCIF